MNHLREDFTTCVGRMLPMINDKILPEVADMIKLYYFKNKDIDFNSGKETIDVRFEFSRTALSTNVPRLTGVLFLALHRCHMD